MRASLLAQLVKNPPAMLETWVRPLDWEDPLEKGKATHSSILGWKIPWTIQFSSVAQSYPTLCDPMNRSTPGLPVHHQLSGHESESEGRSVMSDSATTWTIQSMEFSSPEYWSG